MEADAALVDRLVARQETIHAAECAQVMDMLQFVADARGRAPSPQAGSLEAEAALHELSLATRVPVGSLQGALAAARFARAKLPNVWDFWLTGLIGATHVGSIVDKAHRLRRAESLEKLDADVLAIATTRTVTQLRRWLARFVDRTEPDQAERRHRDAKRERCVYVQTGDDGMSWLSALLPSAEAAAIDAQLEKAARAMPSTDQNGDGRTHDQKRADAFSDTFLGTDETAGSSRIDIGVIVPIQSLIGLSDAPGETIDRSASVPASYIRNLAARKGTLFWRLLTDERGDLLDVARMGRYATGDLAMAIRFRDGTSVFPTSIVPADDSDNDHTDPYPEPTTAANIGALHRRAHRLKTAGVLKLRQPEPGTFEWDTSTGHTYIHKPDPFPIADWAHDPWFEQEFVDAVTAEIAQGHQPDQRAA